MPFYTPLRYPGGKRRLASLVADLVEHNGLRDIQYAEPYAGGAAIALALLFEEYASVVHINDLSRPVYAFWHLVLNDNAGLCRRIENTEVTMREWRRQRAVYENRDAASLDDLGFAALFLNRTNRSGIIAGGVIGGKKQTGAWGVDARFGKPELIQRIRKIGRFSSRIKLYQMDALQFTTSVVAKLRGSAFAFYDPPYIENGKDLYLNEYTLEGHRGLAKEVERLNVPWIVTYDYSAVRHNLYSNCRRIAYGLQYTAHGRHEGKEVLFLSNGLGLPAKWGKKTPVLMSPGGRQRAYVYGTIEKMKPQSAMIEGPHTNERSIGALKTTLKTPKAAMPTPFSKSSERPRESTKRRG